ncbi:MAG: hypothetical protein ACRCZP_11050, partial [Phycicoccus sp.]
GSGPIAFGPAQVGSIGGAALLTPVGLVLAIALPYALGAAALGEVALARVLLDRTPDRLGSALTEVVASRAGSPTLSTPSVDGSSATCTTARSGACWP